MELHLILTGRYYLLNDGAIVCVESQVLGQDDLIVYEEATSSGYRAKAADFECEVSQADIADILRAG